MLIEVEYHNFNSWLIGYFRELLLINKDVTLTKKINFGRSESWSGSRVPLIQKKIEFIRRFYFILRSVPSRCALRLARDVALYAIIFFVKTAFCNDM